MNNLKAKGDQVAVELSSKVLELARVKEEQAEQARLVKRLQRKLQLVTRERDSYKVGALGTSDADPDPVGYEPFVGSGYGQIVQIQFRP